MGALVGFDLDDTLYPESHYVLSGQAAVAEAAAELACTDASPLLRIMAAAPSPAEGFDALHHVLLHKGLKMPVGDMIDIYRAHTPRIALSPVHATLLDDLSRRGHELVLITDGNARRQHAKIEALGLYRWFDRDHIIVSDDAGTNKRTEVPFAIADSRWPRASRFYIGDNPAKDFIWPNRRGWHSVMLLRHQGVWHQAPGDFPAQNAPRTVITSLSQIMDFIL